MGDLSSVPDACIRPPEPDGPLRPVEGWAPKKIQYPKEILRLPIKPGDRWVWRADGTNEVVIRGMHPILPDRVLITHASGKRVSITTQNFYRLYRKKGCPDPRLDRVVDRLGNPLPGIQEWGAS